MHLYIVELKVQQNYLGGSMSFELVALIFNVCHFVSLKNKNYVFFFCEITCNMIMSKGSLV
jgi:hypothetical protein